MFRTAISKMHNVKLDGVVKIASKLILMMVNAKGNVIMKLAIEMGRIVTIRIYFAILKWNACMKWIITNIIVSLNAIIMNVNRQHVNVVNNAHGIWRLMTNVICRNAIQRIVTEIKDFVRLVLKGAIREQILITDNVKLLV